MWTEKLYMTWDKLNEKIWATHIICICIYIIDEVNYSTKFISLNFLLEVAPE